MSRAFLAAALIATLAMVPAQTVAAQTAAGCQAGEAPHFTFGFADLKAQIGDDMGNPLTCEFPDPKGTGDVHQRTTTGLAFWRKSTNTPTFTNGFDHWAETPAGWVTWTGASVDPPTAAVPVGGTPTGGAWPDAVVQGFTRGCEGASPGDPQLQAACACAITQIQATYSLGDFLRIAAQILQQGTMPPEFAGIVAQCVSGVAPS